MSVSAIILAAGESKRMGEENKLLLTWERLPLVTHVVTSVIHSKASECIVVVGHDAVAMQDTLKDFPVRFVYNDAFQEGMSTSIHAGVHEASEDALGYMICLSDMPFISTDAYDALIDHFLNRYAGDDRAIVVPAFDGQRGNPVLISRVFKPAILANRGIVGCRSIVKDNPSHVNLLPMEDDHVLRDVDTPAAYRDLTQKAPLE